MHRRLIRPIRDNVLVGNFEEYTKNRTKIILPDIAKKEDLIWGTVLAVGPGRPIKSGRAPMGVYVGDVVLFVRYLMHTKGGEALTQRLDDGTFLIREKDILVVKC